MDHLGHLEKDCTTIAEILGTARWDSAVPYCPKWTLAELIRHLGGVHRWATAIVNGAPPKQKEQPAPEQDAELPAWFAEGAERLLNTLRTVGPDAACYTFGDPAGRSRFWHRRQALETAVHRVDAQRACGLPVSFDSELAADGIDEVVTVLYPRQVRLGRTDAVAPVRVRAGEREWLVGTGEPVGSIEGPAPAVLLALWHRLELGDPALTVSGAAAASLQAAITS